MTLAHTGNAVQNCRDALVRLLMVLAWTGRSGQHWVMTTLTHATLATFHMDLTREAEPQEGMSRMIVPSVRSSQRRASS